MPGKPGDEFDFKFDFVGTRGGPENSLGDLTKYAILELDFPQGEHASGEPTPRVGLPNILEQGDMFATVDLLLADPLFDGF